VLADSHIRHSDALNVHTHHRRARLGWSLGILFGCDCTAIAHTMVEDSGGSHHG
jgi:hypothetical protein